MPQMAMSEGARDIEKMKDALESKQVKWSMYTPFFSALLAVIPATIAIRESRAEGKKEKATASKAWTRWHIWAAVLGASMALIPAYLTFEEIKINRLAKKQAQPGNKYV